MSASKDARVLSPKFDTNNGDMDTGGEVARAAAGRDPRLLKAAYAQGRVSLAEEGQPLFRKFDRVNGDYDRVDELVRGCLAEEERALLALRGADRVRLQDMMEEMYPEYAEQIRARLDLTEDEKLAAAPAAQTLSRS